MIYLVRGDHKADPAVIHRQQEVALIQIDGDGAAGEQQQRVHRHHRAVADEYLAAKQHTQNLQCIWTGSKITEEYKGTRVMGRLNE